MAAAGDWLNAASACRTLPARTPSLATADRGTAASSPPTTRTKTRRRKPLTDDTPLSLGSVRAGGPPQAGGHSLSPIAITLRRRGGHVMWQKVTTVTATSPGLLFPPPLRGRVRVGGPGRPPVSIFYFSIGAPIRLPHSVHDPS